jgi:prolyl-tRNA editing enzyme YbaK/EbsC (Cys-tRNA(Pro) deacylase)
MSHAWPEPVERVSAVLRAAAVDARVEQFDEGTPTARDAAKAVACELSQIVKTLVFVCDGAFVLALVPGDRRADERAVAQAVGASSVRVAKADEVVQATGFEAGGVAPFPQLQVSQTLIDSSFFAHGIVWIGAGTR